MLFNRVFWAKTSRKMFWSALLTAIIVFCTALATEVTTEKMSHLILVSAFLSAVAAFCQTLLEYVKHGKRKGSNG